MNNNMDKRTLEITLEQAKSWYKGDNEVLKTLALQAFTEAELQPITCVKSWEEFCEKYSNAIEYYIDNGSNIDGYQFRYRYVDGDRNLLKTPEDAEAVLAFIQLKRLRDQWWEALNWKPDYTDDSCKYTIVVDKNEISIGTAISYHMFLAFPNEEIAEDFLSCFIDLINKAKELL